MPAVEINELKNDIKNKAFARAYALYGSENYLKKYYLSRLIESAVGNAFPEFNIKTFTEDMSIDEFINACDSLPMMNDKTLVVVREFDIFKAPESSKEKLCKLFTDAPEHCIMVFYYGNMEFSPDKRTKLFKLLSKAAKIIEFKQAGKNELTSWIKRRFAAHDRIISSELCDYLMFLCGDLMQSLIPEIEKIAAYSRKREIDKRDIDAVASPTPSAIIFNLTDALAAKDLDRAINISEQLKSSGQESIPTLAMIAKQFRQLYSAKLMHSEREIMELWGIHHPFRARLIINSARSMKLDWIKYAITLCAETDISLKTTSNANEIEVMIAKLAAYREVNNAKN